MKPSDLKALAKEAMATNDPGACPACRTPDFGVCTRNDPRLVQPPEKATHTLCLKCGHVMMRQGPRTRNMTAAEKRMLQGATWRDAARAEQEKVVKHLIG